jgi:hypothetical protein
VAPYDNQFLGAAIQKRSARLGRWVPGTVRSLYTSQDVRFGGPEQKPFTFCGLIECQAANDGGDSGSVIVVDDLPLAIHIAGDSIDRSWSIPMTRVVDGWALEVVQFE